MSEGKWYDMLERCFQYTLTTNQIDEWGRYLREHVKNIQPGEVAAAIDANKHRDLKRRPSARALSAHVPPPFPDVIVGSQEVRKNPLFPFSRLTSCLWPTASVCPSVILNHLKFAPIMKIAS